MADRQLPLLPKMLISLIVLLCVSWHLPTMAQDEPLLVDPIAALNELTNNQLVDIQFTRSNEGYGVATLTFDNNRITPQLIASKQQLTLTLPDTKLAQDQLFTLNVAEFATPIAEIETFSRKGASVLEFNLLEDVVFTHNRNENQLVLTVKPQSTEQAQNASVYNGDPISLDFQDVPVRNVLQIIAQVNGFNLVTTDTVRGNVTVSLSGVPWDQALDMILKIRGLDKRLEGNILLIAPSEELASRETQQLQNRQQVAQLAPLISANLQINYAKAKEIASILKNAESSILSPRGSVAVDERTNTVLLRDTQLSIDEARMLISALDIPVKQVLIESRMVTVRDNVDEQLGVRWGLSNKSGNSTISGSLEGADTLGSGVVPSLDNRMNVNLPVTGAAGSIGIQVARLVDGTILDLELSALESENKGEVIASPRITVANQREAYIEQGTEIPYVQSTSSGATSVEFKKAVLSLKVTPHITPDHRIILDLVVTQDTRGDTVNTSTGLAVAIDTQEISTQVLVNNGETIVLGGIFQQTRTDDVTQIPLLGDIPFFGHLFKSTQMVNEKRELLIFVTPKILLDNAAAQ
ncbi:type IV pilus secretin PilQ [Paraglaciecola polaris]|uniref:Type IV pilus assembly protein PilQ n=1 Tax=Paraglaciecola polaris LMG 21857 TaxID=1129793 RepID=K6YMV2_9ALTE|nr:type IV pilus secretin PilQ family protein [Paraglaciecola polaris]GAC34024.1 type IV pilus assembly protein PilQ [Paraglaciecola polaris LMG 21857]|tara:strand:+ start:7607 stop:9349 length:1743 start_codon:yes stop_codon:yes gene_type:complete